MLFADLKGSTELIRDLDPEAAQQLLDPGPATHDGRRAPLRRHGEPGAGDGIMALFGAPVAHEDHAVRACYAALAMQAAMRRYAEEVRRTHGLEMQARVGLNSGEVVVRAIGNDLHMDYSAVGQTTHLAARMEQLATPGSIRLTAATLRLVEGLVQVNALGQFPVKGLTEPVEVFELIGASAIRGACRPVQRGGSPALWDGSRSWQRLQQALEQAGAGHGQVVAVVGEAGVGKSRLVYEFVHSHHTPGWLVLESASVSYGKATPYFPVIDLLKRYCHIDEHDDTRTIRAKLTGQVLTLDEALQDDDPGVAGAPGRPAGGQPVPELDPPSAASARSTPSSACCCVRARCSRCCWSSRICTGSTPRRRPCSTAWWRACPRPGCCSWSTTGPSTSTAGAARPTTRNCGSTRCRPASADEFFRPCWGTIPVWSRSNSC